MPHGSASYNLPQGNLPWYNNNNMATSSGNGEWVVQSDPGGIPYLYNTATHRTHNFMLDRQTEPSNPLLPEAVPVGFNVRGGPHRYPDAVSDPGQSWTQVPTGPWKEYTDPATGNQYWYNQITGERKWECPVVDNKPPPSPPEKPSPPKKPSPPTSSPPKKTSAPYVKETREQWSRYTNIMGAAIWYNSVTGKAQKDKPRCMMKYR